MEITRVNLPQGRVAGDAGVVDDDVDLEFAGFGVGEVDFGGGDDVFGAVGVAHVGLDSDGANVVRGLELGS